MFFVTYLFGVMFPDFKNSHYPLIPYHNLDLVCYLSEHPQIQNSMSHFLLRFFSFTHHAEQQMQYELLLQLSVKKYLPCLLLHESFMWFL